MLKNISWLLLLCLVVLSLVLSQRAQADTPTATITVAGVELSNHGTHIHRVITQWFPDAPYMAYVANCESTGLIHRDSAGRLLPNKSGSGAHGVFQVMLNVHQKEVERLDLDVDFELLRDYMWYVRFLYDTQGLGPWAASRHCWGKYYRRLT